MEITVASVKYPAALVVTVYFIFIHTAPGMSDMDFVPEPAGLALYYVATGSSQVRKVVFPTQPIPTASAPLRYPPSATAERVFDSRRPADGAAPLAGNAARTVTTRGLGTWR
jgi:hypothetical protein